MACTKPLKAWKYGVHESGKTKLVFRDPKDSHAEIQMVPCGKCISCKLDYAREWATRITHEAETSKISCFLTLTIAPDQMVTKGFTRQEKRKDGSYLAVYYPPYSVYKRTIQLFIKNLRDAIVVRSGKKRHYQRLKYFACGEYGEGKGKRRVNPHYHIIIMGFDFPDKVFWKYSHSGEAIYRSELLEKIWPYGYSSIGEVTFQSAGYVARYTLKKSKDKQHYEFVDGYDEETGEIFIHGLHPEFITMSKGIGKDWWMKYRTDTDKDYLNVDFDKKCKVPRYYDKLREEADPKSMEEIKERRKIQAQEQLDKETYQRKYAKRAVKQAQFNMLRRGLEHEKNDVCSNGQAD